MDSYLAFVIGFALVGLGGLFFIVKAVKRFWDQKKEKSERQALLSRSRLELEQLELFAFAATHDLLDPLHKIQAFIELLNTQHRDQLNAQGQDYLQRILRASKKMQQVIERIRDFSQVMANGKEFEQIDLNDIVREAQRELEEKIKQTQATIRVAPLPSIRGDRFQLVQLFSNLIHNAIKFHQPFTSPSVAISSYVKAGEVDILIEDNGIGFDEKYAHKLFKPFQHLNSVNDHNGIGLGLSICQQIMLRHGGQIKATSKPSQGTTFILSFPLFPSLQAEDLQST